MTLFETVESAATRGEWFSIGKSVCGKDILCAHRGGRRGKQLIITAGIHARECYTALVVLRQIEEFIGSGGDGVYFIPLVNPDGALFFETGDTQGSETLERFKGSYREWKANADGVDLNCNFDANWGTGRQNKRFVSPSDYIGEYPLCAPESRALASFTERVLPAATVSYHCMGGELYWEFFQDGQRRMRDEAFAAAVARSAGVKKVDGHLFSAGGYKDYCVQKLKIPAFTIELIERGTHPFGADDFKESADKNAGLPEFMLEYMERNRL